MINYIKREIYEVSAKVVDAAGSYNNLTGYPQSFDSHQNNDDIEKAKNKAYAAFDEAGSLGYTAATSGRPLTIVSLVRISDGRQIEKKCIGDMPFIEQEVPDSEPEPEENGGE